MNNLFNFLMRNEDDKKFFEEYYGDETPSNIYDFRINQRIHKSIGRQDFINRYHEDNKAALELFFQEPLSNNDVDAFIQSNKPLDQLYKLSCEHIGFRLHGLLAHWDLLSDDKQVPSFADSLK